MSVQTAMGTIMPLSSFRPSSLRQTVFAFIQAADRPVTAREIAGGLGIGYKRVVDALSALYNYGRIRRCGRKYSARWARLERNDADQGWKELMARWHSFSS